MGHAPHPARSRSRRLRRPLLALLAAGALAPAAGGGCLGGFDPPSLVNGLRVLAVTVTGEGPDGAVVGKSYAKPGDEVTFTMTYHDGYPGPEEGARPVQIVWLGGCFDPPGDQYFACYDQLADLFADLASGATGPDPSCVAQGKPLCLGPDCSFCGGPELDEFQLRMPDDIVSRRPPPELGPYYGIAYVFFAACAGRIGAVTDAGGKAGSFPLGCFDTDTGQRLGAESFVPGYTQIYVFDDGRENQNPTLGGLTLDGEPIPEEFDAIPTVKRCELTDDERRVGGCGKEDPFAACTTYEIEAIVDPNTAEIDPESTGEDGEHLKEVVWVDYFSDQGDFETGIKLVNDAVEGFNDENEVKWIPPAEPGVVTLWAVLRDARGGSAVVQRFVRVE